MPQKHVGSVLGLCSKADVKNQPYAHIVADAPYEPALYDRLSESFPPTVWFLGGLDTVKSNQAVRIPASHVIGNEKFSPEWQDFFRYHTSQDFWDDIVRVFGDKCMGACECVQGEGRWGQCIRYARAETIQEAAALVQVGA